MGEEEVFVNGWYCIVLFIWWCDYFVGNVFSNLEFEIFDEVVLDLNWFVVMWDEFKLIYKNFMWEFVLFFFGKIIILMK